MKYITKFSQFIIFDFITDRNPYKLKALVGYLSRQQNRQWIHHFKNVILICGP